MACPPQAPAGLAAAADRNGATLGGFLASGNDASAALTRFMYPGRLTRCLLAVGKIARAQLGMFADEQMLDEGSRRLIVVA